MIHKYNKLVRDNIPTQVNSRGNLAKTHEIKNPDVFVAKLADKLVEEAAEFRESLSIEELADIEEVVYALAEELATIEHLNAVRVVKASIRGTYENRVFLESIEEPDVD